MIQIYTTSWCGDCLMAKRVLEQKGITYNEIDIDEDKQGAEFVRKTNRGMRSVPTIVFRDGSTLTEPSAPELIAKLEDLGL